MGAPDAQGIYQYTETDTASPVSTMLNRLASSVSTALGALRGSWATHSLTVGYAVAAGFPTTAYRVADSGTRVELRSTRITVPNVAVTQDTDVLIAPVGTLPAAARPTQVRYALAWVYLTAAPSRPVPARLNLNADGSIGLRAPATGTCNLIDLPSTSAYLPAA